MSLTTNNHQFDDSHIATIRKMLGNGVSESDFMIFLHQCKRTGLDPLLKQIYCIPMGGKVNIMTSIDGARLIAERSGNYAPGGKTEYEFDKNGNLLSATAYVKKRTQDGMWHEVSATAYLSEYSSGKNLWQKMPKTMLEKCFSEDTEVLTEFGFKKFSEVNGRIMQVTDNGLDPVLVKPFCQDYSGEMINHFSKVLDFSVTPNHDMITTSGKIEAGDMYDLCVTRPSFFIPMTVPEDKSPGIGMSKEQIELSAASMCDGDHMSSKSFRIKVSRPHKVEKIRSWNLHYQEKVINVAGKECRSWSSDRTLITKNDQIQFSFNMDKVSPLVIPHKRINHSQMMKMNSQEAKWFIDAWSFFDGNLNSCENRNVVIYTSDVQYVSWIELLAIKAGYSISSIRARTSDIAKKKNFSITLSKVKERGVSRYHIGTTRNDKYTGLEKEENKSGKVWCVTVPSGSIVVRREGFSMVCGNCAEMRALRRAFPSDLSGLYAKEEIDSETIEIVEYISEDQEDKLSIALEGMDDFKNTVLKGLRIEKLSQIPASRFDALMKRIEQVRKEKEKDEVPF